MFILRKKAAFSDAISLREIRNSCVFILLGLCLAAGAQAQNPQNGTQTNTPQKPNYSAISGDVAADNHDTWESYYRRKSSKEILPPVEVVRDFSPKLAKGAKILCPAMGEGRNALYLAKAGFDVFGNDISESAVQKVRAEAHHQKIKIQTKIEDLTTAQFQPASFDAIVLSYFHLPELVQKWKSALKPGGHILIQQRIPGKQKTRKEIPSEFTVQRGEMEKAFAGWKTIYRTEIKSAEKNSDGPSVVLVFQKP